MADYQIRVYGLREHERTFEAVEKGLMAEMFEDPWFGTVKSVEFDGDEADVTMTGATREVAFRLNGRRLPLDPDLP